jgi:broad specificity phosphatase PhoE
MIWWLRHGESTWNVVGRQQGHTAHPPLTDRGREQAARAAERLAGLGITRLLASPLARAQETAQIIGLRLGLEVEVEPDLIEKGFAEGVPEVVARVRDLIKRIGDDQTVLAVTHGDTLAVAVGVLTGDSIPLPANCEAIGVDPATGQARHLGALQ